MKSSKEAPNLSAVSTQALRDRFRPYLEKNPDSLTLWLPQYRTPSPNLIYGKHWSVYRKHKAEARARLYNASVSKLHSVESAYSIPTTNGDPLSPYSIVSGKLGSSPMTESATSSSSSPKTESEPHNKESASDSSTVSPAPAPNPLNQHE